MRTRAPRPLILLTAAYVVACASPGPPVATAAAEMVPATSPNFRPPTLDDGLVLGPHGDQVSTTVLSVIFEVGATQSDRQAAIDSVDGTVIGGVNTGSDGWYYVRVEGDGTIETIYELAHALDALPQVALASPYTVFGSEADL